MKRTTVILSALVALSMLLAACQTAAETPVMPAGVTEPPSPTVVEYARNETLYMGGTQWGPPTGFNPWNLGNYATGTFGLCYEPLFNYDPLADEFTPWLAESGAWISEDVYEIKVRQGIQWSTGEPFTAADVKATFDIAHQAPVSISPVWAFLGSVDLVDDYTVQFTFSQALYQRWSNYLYTTPIISQARWEDMSVEEITSGINPDPECTGPYVPEALEQDRVVWVRAPGWWATSVYGLDPKPTRIVDIVNSSNNVALGLVVQGGIDLSNHFLPGMASIVRGGYGISTYYPDAPYHLSANTAWLLLNNQQKPMDDVAFRRAVAYAIDTDQIVNVVYGGMVMKANPTGLLPAWDQYVDQGVVDELGFGYDPEQAKAILAEASYADVDGDGFVEAPDGSRIELTIMVPNGWSDWMESIRVVANGCQAAGINLTTEFPDYPAYLDAQNNGTFDMMINNGAQFSNTPWSYYNWMAQNPVADIATIQNGNYGRYDNQQVFDLVDQLDQVPTDDLEGMKAVASQLQRAFLTDMPLIPLWYNGMWAQVNNTYWTNWPSAAEGAGHWTPSSWRGYWNMTAIRMLSDLQPAQP